jgi:DNA excision repair protein ERCC-4
MANLEFSVSSMPEKHGSDIVSITPAGLIGFQRKTLPDLQSSLLDGRLYYELSQLRSSTALTHSFLIIESDLRRTTDGALVDSTLSLNAVRSIIAKFSANGVGYLPSFSIRDTAEVVDNVSRYISSDNFKAIRRPKDISDTWGRITNESFALWFLQSFPGVGPKVAKQILQHFGRVPIEWSVTEKELRQVPGVGKKMAADLLSALDNP